jgi:alginate O-acetyltransferase complex protein AlgI
VLFNSIPFALFLPCVLVLYWAVQRAPLRVQNSLLLLASYVFYGMWDWRFPLLLLVSSSVDYLVSLKLPGVQAPGRKKLLLGLSVAVNLLMLAFFKYFNFFVISFAELMRLFGLNANMDTIRILMPVGISYYTFKKLSYIIDVYRGTISPTRDAPAFFAFIAFFPQLIAGPIDRGTTLLPQFLAKRPFSESLAKDGLRQILSGFMKKMILADNLLPLVKELFAHYPRYDGLSLVIGIFFAAMQLYCDFSGYSDIAIGIGKLFGFRLMRNFSVPYFSRDIAEFWRRWHISLSSWIRDYVYVPLCGVRPSRARKAVDIVLAFTICGFWHEAAWTFVFWGFLHGLYFLPMTLRRRHPRFLGTPAKGRLLPSLREGRAMAGTFMLTSIAWVFFMSDSFGQAFGLLGRVAAHPFMNLDYSAYLPMLIACGLLLAVEWIQREKEFFLQIGNLPLVLRWGIYYVSLLLIIVFGAFGSTGFMYTQF